MSETLKPNADSTPQPVGATGRHPYHAPQVSVLGPIASMVKAGQPGGGLDFTGNTMSEAS
jgi:hypothetical protein